MKTFLADYQRIAGTLNYVSLILLLMSLAFPWHFSQPLFTIWLVTWLLEGRWLQRTNWRFDKSLIPVLLMCGFVVWEAISLFWTQDISSGKSELERHLPVFALALMSLVGSNDQCRSYKMKTALMVGSLLAVLSYFMIVYWFIHMDWLYKHWPEFHYETMLGNGPIRHIKHRLYLCLVLVLAVFFSGDVYRYFRTRYSRIACLVTIGVADMLLISAIILTGSRTTIMLLPVLGAVLLAIQLPKKFRWYIIGGFAALVIAGGITLMRHNWRFQLMQQDIQALRSHEVEVQNIEEPRVYIWSTILRHTDEYGVFGLGVGSSDGFLRKCYEQDHYNGHFGAHNNYLYTLMDLGIFGVVYLLLALCAIPFFHTGKARHDALLACLLFGCCMFTENLLTMMSSLYIVFALIALIQTEQREQDVLPLDRP